MSRRTKPEVFIIESLRFVDERHCRTEGEIISRLLGMSGKKCIYYYVRTERELRRVLGLFKRSNYRYLHLSCHANHDSMATTLDGIPFTRLGKLLRGRLVDRRLFVSACSMASPALASALIPSSGCYSILGPADDIEFGDAAALWCSLYHLMFRTDDQAMTRKVLRKHAHVLATAFNVKLNLFVSDDRHEDFKLIKLLPEPAD